MKLFLKILLFILSMFITVVEVQSSTVVNPFHKGTGFIEIVIDNLVLMRGATGSAAGFTMNTGFSLIQRECFDDALESGKQGTLMGLGIELTTGLISGMRSAYIAGENPWTGKPIVANGGVQGIKSLGAAAKGFSEPLQTGGHTLKNSTLKELGLSQKQGYEAIYALKKDWGIPNNAHFNIMRDGSVVHPHTEFNYGTLFDYIP